jgi:hypothetical protein
LAKPLLDLIEQIRQQFAIAKVIRARRRGNDLARS